MEVTATPPPAVAGTQPNIGEQGRGVLSSDFETFLKMLTAQMENQDPLNPVESTEFASQLAAFSAVEQQVLTNDHLAGLGTQLGVMGLSQLSGWIGHDVRAPMAAYFDGSTPIEIRPKTADLADAATLVVHDGLGQEVARQPLELGSSEFGWTGTDFNGNPLPPATYRFTVESRSNGELIDSTTPEIYARVEEARLNNGAAQLVLQGGTVIAATDVTALRD